MTTTYRGTDRRGAGISGTLPDGADLGAFVQRKYRQGWRWLTLERDGREVGGIQRSRFHPALWWSE